MMQDDLANVNEFHKTEIFLSAALNEAFEAKAPEIFYQAARHVTDSLKDVGLGFFKLEVRDETIGLYLSMEDGRLLNIEFPSMPCDGSDQPISDVGRFAMYVQSKQEVHEEILIALTAWKCLKNNDPKGMLEVIENYMNRPHIVDNTICRESVTLGKNPTLKKVAKFVSDDYNLKKEYFPDML